MERLDPVVAAIVRERPPPADPQGQYGYRRQGERRPRKKRQQLPQPDGNDNTQIQVEFTDPLLGDAPMLAGIAPMPATTQSMTPMKRSKTVEGSEPGSPESVAVERLVATAPQPNGDGEAEESPAEDGNDAEDPDWIVRIGNEPPPGWAKRTISDEAESSDSYARRKRQRTMRLFSSPKALIDGFANPFHFSVKGHLQTQRNRQNLLSIPSTDCSRTLPTSIDSC